MKWGLYIHVPFCRQKCFYCDFPSWAGKDNLMEDYAEAITAEFAQKRKAVTPPATVYIGGGTPTALPKDLLKRIIDGAAKYFFDGKIPTNPDFEFTCEVNPGTVDFDYLAMLKNCGVNRLSVGVQSLNDRLLKTIGRIHDAKTAKDCIRAARAAGFKNIGTDIIYALPTQTTDEFAADLSEIIALSPEHISVYGLTVEEGTKFFAERKKNNLPLPTEEETDAMYALMTEKLPAEGYNRYEISNFAKKNYQSRHNLGYWQWRPYMGAGCGAHSFWGGERFMNNASLEGYMLDIAHGKFFGARESKRSEKDAMAEFCFLALRTAAGVDKEKFAAEFSRDFDEVYGETTAKFIELGAMIETKRQVVLTELGMKYGNMIFAEFV